MDKQLSHFSHALRRMGMMMVMMLFAVMVYAQNIKVTGTVTDSSGEPIVGAVTSKAQMETLQKLIDQTLAADMG